MKLPSMSLLLFLLVAILVSSFSSSSFSSAQSTRSILNINPAIEAELVKREQSLNTIVSAIEVAESDRCTTFLNWNRNRKDSCSVAAVANTFPAEDGFTCHTDLGSNLALCNGDSSNQACNGLIRSEEKSVVLFAPGTAITNVDAQVFLSIGGAIENVQREERKAGRSPAWMGYASSHSLASRWYPGFPTNRGSQYNPLERDWYVAGSTSGKDLILCLDVSGSMLTRDSASGISRLELLIRSVHKILGTLFVGDHFAIVTFSSAATSRIITNSGRPILVQATKENIAIARNGVDQIIASGNTNFASAFSNAFRIFQQSTESTSGCARVILFLSDGVASDRDTIVNYIEQQKASTGIRPYIFTFTMSTGAELETPRAIACSNQGIHIHQDHPREDFLAQYSQFLAVSIVANSTAPKYSNIYEDFFGLKSMTTLSKSVFSDRSSPHPIFRGVASVDVPISDLLEFGTMDQILASLAKRSSACPIYNVSECQLQLLRQKVGSTCAAPALSSCKREEEAEEIANCSSSSSSSVSSLSDGINGMLCEPIDLHLMRGANSKSVKSLKEVSCCVGCLTDDDQFPIGVIAGVIAGSLVCLIVALLIARNRASASSSSCSFSSKRSVKVVPTTTRDYHAHDDDDFYDAVLRDLRAIGHRLHHHHHHHHASPPVLPAGAAFLTKNKKMGDRISEDKEMMKMLKKIKERGAGDSSRDMRVVLPSVIPFGESL